MNQFAGHTEILEVWAGVLLFALFGILSLKLYSDTLMLISWVKFNIDKAEQQKLKRALCCDVGVLTVGLATAFFAIMR